MISNCLAGVRFGFFSINIIVFVTSLLIFTNGHPAGDEDKIMYPDHEMLTSVGKMTPRCSKSSKVFCTDVENYPSTHIKNLIKADLNRYAELFGEDLVVDVANRFDGPGENYLCDSIERLIFPKAGFNKDNAWRFIANDDKFKQGIRVEECTNTGSNCTMADIFPNGYKTECRQSYIYRQLLSVSKDGLVTKDQFQFPSSCKCLVKN